MPPKKGGKGAGGKGKGKKEKEVDPNLVTEVDRTFYELTIADLNRKLARLRSLTEELEVKNEELLQEKQKLDEDRADIIIYLKRTLQEKTDENRELGERIVAMEESRQDETEKYEEKIADMQEEYHQMHDQLKSENQLLEGKLNALEEFRSQRDDLMRKFENQENEMEAQEKRHKRELYEIERKFIIKRDQLKRDMEAKIRDLSTEFHDTTEMRIAATTHKVIRENIAVNNELDLVLATQQRLYNENCRMKKRDTNLKQQVELLEVEKNNALANIKVQLKIIQRLTDDHMFMKNEVEKYKRYESEVLDSRGKIKILEDNITQLEYTKKILEQNLHHVRCDRTSLQTELLYVKSENDHLNNVLKEAVCCIKETLSMSAESDTWLQASRRDNLLGSLFTLLCEAREHRVRLPSLETVDSMEATYKKGDLGFVPKPVELRSRVPTKRNMESQTATSFQEYLQYGDTTETVSKIKSGIIDIDRDAYASRVEMREEVPSVLFFDDTEMPGEEEGSQDLGILALEEEEDEDGGTATPTVVTETETEKESPTDTESPGIQPSPEREGQETSPRTESPGAQSPGTLPHDTESPPEATSSEAASGGIPPETQSPEVIPEESPALEATEETEATADAGVVQEES